MCEQQTNNLSNATPANKDEILMLFLFRGGYLTESNMLGHEIINLFQDDDGHHYIYVLANSVDFQ